MKWRMTFHGRKIGALGLQERVVREVEAPDVEAARLQLYETHEHITVLLAEVLFEGPAEGEGQDG